MLAFLHADGMVRLRDMDGEEIVAFDAGHRRSSSSLGTSEPSSPATTAAASSASAVDAWPSEGRAAAVTVAAAAAAARTATPPPVVVGLAADASEAGPVLVTAGVDGAVRVHALAVHYRGKQVAGAGMRGDRARRGGSGSGGSTGKRKGETPDGGGGSDGRGSGSSSSSRRSGDEQVRQKKASSAGKTKERDGSRGGDSRHVSGPPATAMGVGISVELKTCLGSACGSFDDSAQIQSAEAGDVNASAGKVGAAAGSLPPLEETAAVTSMDAYFHRS